MSRYETAFAKFEQLKASLIIDGYEIISQEPYENTQQRIKLRHSTCQTIFEPKIIKLLEGSRCPNNACYQLARTKTRSQTGTSAEPKFREKVARLNYEIVEKDFSYKGKNQIVEMIHVPCGTHKFPSISNFMVHYQDGHCVVCNKDEANSKRSSWTKANSTLDYGWKKGLTKEDHPGIANQAEKISKTVLRKKIKES